jgi:site-specific recombinase XerD
VSSTDFNVCTACGGRENASFKRPRTGFTSWDVWKSPKPKIVPFADRLADFAAYRRDERGLSPATIRCQSWHVEKFCSWMGEQNRGFDDVSLEDVDAFLAAMGKRGWGRVSVAASASALHGFFQHAAERGWCAASIAAGIDGPRLFRYEGLPVGPSWSDVQRLIASTGGDCETSATTPS